MQLRSLSDLQDRSKQDIQQKKNGAVIVDFETQSLHLAPLSAGIIVSLSITARIVASARGIPSRTSLASMTATSRPLLVQVDSALASKLLR
jgi:hypothetical protein